MPPLEEEKNAAVQFALLKEAISLQAAAQDAEALIDTTDMMSQRFKIDGLKIKVHFLTKIAGDTKKKSSDGRAVDVYARCGESGNMPVMSTIRR